MICIIFMGCFCFEGLSFLWSDLKDQFVATHTFYVGVSPPQLRGIEARSLCMPGQVLSQSSTVLDINAVTHPKY